MSKSVQVVKVEAAAECSEFMIEEVRKFWVVLAFVKKASDEAIEALMAKKGSDRVNGQSLECDCVDYAVQEVVGKAMLAGLAAETALENIGMYYSRLEDHDEDNDHSPAPDMSDEVRRVLDTLTGQADKGVH